MSCMRSLSAPVRSAVPSPNRIAFATTSRGLRTRVNTPVPTPDDVVVATDPDKKPLRKIESMPFQTFQLALDVVKKDRAEKLDLIKEKRQKLENILKFTETSPNDQRVKSLQRHLEYLQIQADMNNPRVKYNFDRGISRYFYYQIGIPNAKWERAVGMNRPIYRFLLNRKWREYRRPILMQRLEQMNVVPDVLPYINPVVDVQVRFRGRDIRPGTILDSLQSEQAPTFKIIPFTQDKSLYTVVVVDPDVPDIENDTFKYRLHWLVSNIQISPIQTQAVGTRAKTSDTAVPWLPPHVQKGSPYHRYAIIVFRQPGKLNIKQLQNIERDGFILRSFQGKHNLESIGAFLFRSQWDENTRGVMERHDLPGWDKMFVRRRE